MGWVHRTPIELAHYTLQKLSIMIEMWPCGINSVRMKESRRNPTIIVSTSKIGLSLPNSLLCIHVVVGIVAIIKWQIHNLLVLTHQVPSLIQRRVHAKAKMFKNIIHANSRKCQGLVNNVSLVRGRGCNDDEFGVSPTSIILQVFTCIYSNADQYGHIC